MNEERFHRRLTDVGLYSLGGLCAVSLSDLFYEECHTEFKKKAMEKILLDLGQPKQTNASLNAMLDGEMMKDSRVFVCSILEEECMRVSRQPIVADLIAMAISNGCYDARMRVLIKHVAWQLKVTWDVVEETEAVMAETLEYSTYTVSEEEAKEKEKKTRNRKIKRYAMIGLATVGGGALIGLTGGLAAPLVAAGAGAVIGGAGAAALGSAAGVAIIGSLFGVAGAGLTGYKMKRRVGAIEEFSFEPLTLIGSRLDAQKTVKQLHVTIAVTGWINDKCQDFRVPWSALAESREQYSLRWESKYLSQLGEAFDYILQTGISMATTEALKYTILSGLITAIAWPAALIGASNVIDNPWHVCLRRASEAGKQLAEVLLGREQGNRPVTLIGFSLGSRVIFSCLEELAKRKGGEGLVEDVILLGAPVSGEPKYWKQLTKVVGGKIVNGYSRGDWLLKFLFRTASVTFKAAGLGPVEWTDRRMHNIDLSDVIDGHGDYNKYLDTIMKAVGVRTKDELKPLDNIVKIGERTTSNSTKSADIVCGESASSSLNSINDTPVDSSGTSGTADDSGNDELGTKPGMESVSENIEVEVTDSSTDTVDEMNDDLMSELTEEFKESAVDELNETTEHSADQVSAELVNVVRSDLNMAECDDCNNGNNQTQTVHASNFSVPDIVVSNNDIETNTDIETDTDVETNTGVEDKEVGFDDNDHHVSDDTAGISSMDESTGQESVHTNTDSDIHGGHAKEVQKPACDQTVVESNANVHSNTNTV